MFRVGFLVVLLSAFTESLPEQRTIRKSPTRNAAKFSVNPEEMFNFFSATQPPRQQGVSVGKIPKGATGTILPVCRSVVQQTKTLNLDQIAEIEQRTRNNPDQLSVEMRLRLTPDIFGPICLEKITPEALDAWLVSPRPRPYLWTNERVVRALQAEIKTQMKPSGLIVDKTRGYLAAVPDGLVGDKAVVKVHTTLLLPKDLRHVKSFVGDELSPQKYLYYEIQGLLAITDREDCILVIVSKSMIKPVVIKRNRDFWNNKMVNKIEQFIKKTLLPEPSSQQPLQPITKGDEKKPLREKAREFLTCNVCSELIKPPYKVCRNGHLLCHSCWPQLQRANVHELPKCPTCREPIPPKPSRCLPLEAICNLIDPEMSPTPVIRPDDPMDVGSRPSSPQLPQTQRNWARTESPDLFTRFFPSMQRSFLEWPRTPQLPQTEIGWDRLDSPDPFSRPAWRLHRTFDNGRGGLTLLDEWEESFFEDPRTIESPQTERGRSRLGSPDHRITRLSRVPRHAINRGRGRSNNVEEGRDSSLGRPRPVTPPSPDDDSDWGWQQTFSSFPRPFLEGQRRTLGVGRGRGTLGNSFLQSHTSRPDFIARFRSASPDSDYD